VAAQHECDLPLVVVLATCNRPVLLAERSLASLSAQTRAPDAVVVVDDSDPLHRARNAAAVKLAAGLPQAELIPNARTAGAAGAWNTALSWASARYADCWIAMLDDDDAWAPRHLELCGALARPGVDAVISGIQLRLYGVLQPWSSPPPMTFRDFLRGNPGWQGSNTFVRLSRLLEAGAFDEALESTHDRDLAIRLLRLPRFRATQTGVCTATYHLDDEPRLSTARSERKRLGLAAFWAKHRALMDDEDARAFLDRARHYFGFSPGELGVLP